MLLLKLIIALILTSYRYQAESTSVSQLLGYCNLNSSQLPQTSCAEGLTCSNEYYQCFKPDNSSCNSTWQCSYICYNGTCLSEQQYQQLECNDSSQCPSPYFCSAGKHCRLPPGAACNTSGVCSNFTACINGTCSAPDLYDGCNPNDQTYRCRRGQCHPTFFTCLIPEGGNCTNSIECGLLTELVCSNGKCERPGLNQICLPYNISDILLATKCKQGFCSNATFLCTQSDGTMVKTSGLLMMLLSILWVLSFH